MPDHWVAMPDHRVAMPVHWVAMPVHRVAMPVHWVAMPYHHFNKINIQLVHNRAAMPDRVALPGKCSLYSLL